MDTNQIVSLLVAERDRLNAAIALLTNGTGIKRRGRPPKHPAGVNGTAPAPTKRTRTFTAAQRKQQAERMKQYWARKKKAAAKKP